MSDASVSVIDGRAVVRVGGSELLGIQVAKALGYRNDAAGSAGQAAASADTAQTARDATLAASNYFPSRAAGEAATAVNKLFSTDDAGELVSYRRTSGGSTEIARTLSAARLGGSEGSRFVGFGDRTAYDKMRDVFSVKDFGAIGDGQPHALSTKYATLAAAKVDYPFATSLTQTLDLCGIQAALNYAEGDGYKRRCVRVPDGYYVIYGGASGEPLSPIQLPSWVTLEGETRHGTVIYQQNVPMAAPIFVNKDATAIINTNLRRMTILGGTHFFKCQVTAEQAGMVVEDITSSLQTQGQLEANYLQTTVFRNCDFSGASFAVKINGVCNSNDLYNCRLGDHSGPSLYAHGVVGRFLMVGGSMEAGGNNSSVAIDIDGGDAVSFQGVYFENVHKTILKSRNSTGIDFSNCRFVGTDLGSGLEAFRFDAPTDIISFGSNRWFQTTVGPAVMLIAGHNDNLVGRNSTVSLARSGRRGSDASKSRTFTASLTFDALRFTRPSAGTLNCMTGNLRVTMQGATAGGQPAVKVANFVVAAKGIPGSAVVASFQAGSQLDDNTGFFIQLQETNQSNTGTTLQLVVYGANAAGMSSVSYSFDYIADTSDDTNNIAVTLP